MPPKTSRTTKAHTTNDDAHYRLLVESISDYAIITLDADGHVTTWNKGAERIKGYRAEEILGPTLSRLVEHFLV